MTIVNYVLINELNLSTSGMDEDIPEDLDFLQICRCCLLKLENGRKLKPLFGSAVDAMLREVSAKPANDDFQDGHFIRSSHSLR